MKHSGVLASYVTMAKTPSIQVLLLGTSFLLVMLFVYMGVLTAFDQQVFHALNKIGNVTGWQKEALRDITALGSNTVLIFVTISVAGALAIAGKKKKALTFLYAVAIGIAMTFLLKAGVDRPRPPTSVQDVIVYTQSFPSAHATLSSLVYFYLAYLLSVYTHNAKVRLWAYIAAALVVFCIGLSRVLLGVHWPSDVIAGWFFGGGMAAFSIYAVKWNRKLRVKGQR